MFEDYLKDSYEFYNNGLEASEKLNEQLARRYYRASIFSGASAMEAFLNYTGDLLTHGNSLTPHEKAFLNDKTLTFSSKKGRLEKKIKYFSVDDKLKFLLKKFDPLFNFGTNPEWSNFIEFKTLRDNLVHPKQSEDETELSYYKFEINKGITSIIILMNILSKNIYKKPLRKKLLDLIPE